MRRYRNIPETKGPEGNLMYKTVRYPEIPRSFSDIYVFVTDGDRYDTLALAYYNDSSLWWIISIANAKNIQNSLTPPRGSQIRIPANPIPIVAEFEELNK